MCIEATSGCRKITEELCKIKSTASFTFLTFLFLMPTEMINYVIPIPPISILPRPREGMSQIWVVQGDKLSQDSVLQELNDFWSLDKTEKLDKHILSNASFNTENKGVQIH